MSRFASVHCRRDLIYFVLLLDRIAKAPTPTEISFFGKFIRVPFCGVSSEQVFPNISCSALFIIKDTWAKLCKNTLCNIFIIEG